MTAGLYLLNDEIRQLSKDHSLVQEMVRLGGLNAEEAKHHPDKNIITRAIGVKEDVEIDFFEHRLEKRRYYFDVHRWTEQYGGG